jgi:hypothetical protein
LGTGAYLVAVAIPSMIVNLLAREEDSFFEKNYYNMPWERNADERGGVTRNYSSWADSLASLWFAFWEG